MRESSKDRKWLPLILTIVSFIKSLFPFSIVNSGANIIQRLFFPLLRPEYVADEILFAMKTSSPWTVMPAVLKPALYAMKILPVYIQDYLSSVLVIKSSSINSSV